MPRTYTIAVVLKEHGANGPKPRGSREERTHSQAARTRAAFETQKIRRDSFVLQPDLVEAAGRTDSVTDMTLCVLYLFPGGASSFKLQDRALAFSALRSVNGRNIIFAYYYCSFHYVRISVLCIQLTYSKVQLGQPTQHTILLQLDRVLPSRASYRDSRHYKYPEQ